MIEIVRDNVTNGERTGSASSARAFGGSLRLCKCQNPHAIRIVIIVGKNDLTVLRPQILNGIFPVTAVAPRNPGARAAGELAIAKARER